MCSADETLSNYLIEEAKKEDGTWGSTAIARIKSETTKMNALSARSFVRTILDELECDTTPELTRYKLSQALSIIRNQDLKVFTDAFLLFKDELMQACMRRPNTGLNQATIQNIKKIFQDNEDSQNLRLMLQLYRSSTLVACPTIV